MIIAASILVYLAVAFDVSRRLAWHWNEPYKSDRYDLCRGDRRIGAALLSVFVLPVAMVLLYGQTRGGIGFDKPPRAIRQAAKAQERETKMIEAQSMVEDLQREIDKLAKL